MPTDIFFAPNRDELSFFILTRINDQFETFARQEHVVDERGGLLCHLINPLGLWKRRCFGRLGHLGRFDNALRHWKDVFSCALIKTLLLWGT